MVYCDFFKSNDDEIDIEGASLSRFVQERLGETVNLLVGE